MESISQYQKQREVPAYIDIVTSSHLAYLEHAAQEAEKWLKYGLSVEELPYPLQEALEEYDECEDEFDELLSSLEQKLRQLINKAGMEAEGGFSYYIPSEGVEDEEAEVYLGTNVIIKSVPKLMKVLEEYCDDLEILDQHIYCKVGDSTIHIDLENE